MAEVIEDAGTPVIEEEPMSRKPHETRPEVAFRCRSYLSVTDLDAAETRQIIRTAEKLKARPARGQRYHPLAGRTLAMVFQKPSLRTRVSFETGMTQLGGHAIYLGPDDIRLGARESVEDTALTLSRMADLIMARVFSHAVVEELALHATVPVINGLSDREHPCQILGDLLTIVEHKGGPEGVRIAYIGDGNNVCHSLLYAAGLLGMHLAVAGPRGHAPDAGIVEAAQGLARSSAGEIRVTDRIEDACRDADVVYTDVWASMGQEAEAEARRERFRPYQVNEQVMALARPDAILMHCLPAHYGEELDYATSRGPRSVIFDQAENRLHAQKALLVMLAG
jgi:ornithine carbamoyltransferase